MAGSEDFVDFGGVLGVGAGLLAAYFLPEVVLVGFDVAAVGALEVDDFVCHKECYHVVVVGAGLMLELYLLLYCAVAPRAVAPQGSDSLAE